MTTTDTSARFRRGRPTGRLRGLRPQRPLRSLRPLLLAVLALAATGFGGWVLLFSSWFAAEDVTVAGTTTVSAHDVEAAAEVPLGTPLVRLDLGQIHDRVAALPAVRTVTVHRSWPHTVAITVTERQPVAAIHRDGAWWVLDADGVVFRETGRRDRRVPVVAVPRAAGADAVREAASVVASLPRDLAADTVRLTARSMDSITLRLKDESAVVWGSAAESDRKVEVLKALLTHVKAGVYDVSVPELPTSSG